MGHIIFLILHLICILFGFIGLIVTVLLHLIYAGVTKSNNRQISHRGNDKDVYAECPFCKEKIDHGASKCPYCREWIDEEQTPKLVDGKGRQVKLCSYCGNKNRADDYVCMFC